MEEIDIVWNVGFVLLGVAIQSWLDIIGILHKSIIIAVNKSCSLSIMTYFVSGESDIRDLSGIIEKAFESKGYTIKITSKTDVKTVLEATNKYAETFYVDIVNDDPAMVELKNHKVGIRDIEDSIDEWDALLDALGHKFKINGISFEIVLPYKLGIEIKAPKEMKVEDYTIQFLHNNKSRVTATVNNTITANSEALSTLKECLKSFTRLF